MAKRAYGQFCGLARALDIVGERWTLLIVRDLLVAPKRYTDLRRGLPRIPTNILAARLKRLERAGVARRRIAPQPAHAVVYELTEYGKALEETVLSLSRWGARSLTEPEVVDVVTPDSLIIALRTAFHPEAARGLQVTYELRFGDVIVHTLVDDGVLHTAAGALSDPDLVIETGPVLRPLLAGEVSPAEVIENGGVRLTGNSDLLTRFVEVFHLLPAPSTTA